MNIYIYIYKKKPNWNSNAWRRNCLLKYVIQGKVQGRIDVIGRRGRRRQQLLNDLKEIREIRDGAALVTTYQTTRCHSKGPRLSYFEHYRVTNIMWE